MKATKFKSTELGAIPKDWEVKRFDECFTLMRNNTYARECLTDHCGSVANVHYGDILVKYGAVLNFVKDSIPYLKPWVKPNKDLLKDGDVIFADTAEDETAGKAVEVQGIGDRKAVAGLHTVACRPNEGLFASRYLGYYINSVAYHSQLLPLMTGTKVSSVSRAGFVSTYLALPPIAEQRRIAGALSDVDELISALGKLIEKKRNIKTGTMQQLLTGKTRLPGFKGKWVEKRLGECGEFIGGAVFPVNRQGELCGDYPFFKVSDFSNRGNESELRISNNYISKAVASELGCRIIPAASIVFAKIGAAIALERKRIVIQDSCIDNNMMAFRVNNCNDPMFWVEILRGIRFSDFSESTALPALNIGRLRDFVVGVPALAEQKAIAAVLSDIDAEIAALEADRAKYERIKSGMMQELLTGKTRLKGE